MSAPKNIQRDGKFISLSQARLALATETVVNTGVGKGNSTGAVNLDFASAQHAFGSGISVTAANVKFFGLLMREPIKDRQPYRIKAYARCVSNLESVAIVIGYAPASPTGTDDQIDDLIYLPFAAGTLDELVIIEPQASGDTYFGRPLYFGIAAFGALTTVKLFAELSVQNLGVKPPTMQNAIS